MVDFERNSLADGLTTELQQARNNLFAAQGLVDDFLQICAPLGILRQVLHEHVGIKQDARERIIDFVSDTRSQSPNGSDFFGLHQLNLGFLEFPAYS